jgi:hypothetical protein
MSNDYSPAANTLSISNSGSNGVDGSIHFTYHGVVTEGEAMNLQEDYGYHPAGYGFYGYTVEDSVTTWKCQRSCD